MIGDSKNESTTIPEQRGQGTPNSDDWRKNISPRVKVDLVRKIISALSPALSFVESPEQYQMFHTAFRQAQEIENDAFRRGNSVHDYYTIMANAIYIHQKEAAKEASTRYSKSNRGPKSR